jgi:acyl carrier protein
MEIQDKSAALLGMEEIRQWMVNYVAELLDIHQAEVKTDIPFDRYGLDSLAAVGMTGDLEEWLGEKLDPTLLYDYPTIDAFSSHLAATR